MKNKKAAIIGAGFVGASAAYSLMLDGTADEIVLIDIDHKKACGEADDIAHGVEGTANAAIYAGAYSDCRDSDIIIITAGRGRLPGESRIDLAAENIKIIRSVTDYVEPYYSGCPILMISNPVDILTASAERLLGTPEGRVFGSGCMLDSSRFRRCIARTVFPSDKARQAGCAESIGAFVIGEHGDAQIPLWSGVSVCGKTAEEYCAEHDIVWNDDVRQAIYRETRNMGSSIIKAKGRTNYGIAVCASRIARAVLDDERFTASVSSTMGLGGDNIRASLSLPYVIGGKGLISGAPLSLSPAEKECFEKSAAGMTEMIKDLL